MANIFATEPGTAIAITDPSILPITFVIGGWGGYPVRNSIIQGFSIASQGNYQFLNTLRNFTYVYVFGEKMGDITVTGLTFIGSCDYYNWSGVSNTLGYYANYALSWTGAPVYIAIGLAVFYGFLTGLRLDVRNPEGRLATFTLTYKSIAS
jgi:hypothetical protein